MSARVERRTLCARSAARAPLGLRQSSAREMSIAGHRPPPARRPRPAANARHARPRRQIEHPLACPQPGAGRRTASVSRSSSGTQPRGVGARRPRPTRTAARAGTPGYPRPAHRASRGLDDGEPVYTRSTRASMLASIGLEPIGRLAPPRRTSASDAALVTATSNVNALPARPPPPPPPPAARAHRSRTVSEIFDAVERTVVGLAEIR